MMTRGTLERGLLLGVAVAVIGLAGCKVNTSGSSATSPINPTAASQGSSAPASSSAAAHTATVGDTVAFKDDSGSGEITLNGVRWMTTAEGPIGGPPKNGAYLVVNVTVKADAGTVTPNPLAFKVSTPDGTTYQSELGVLDNQIPSDDVPAGRQVRGEVAFDVPKGQPFLMDYAIFGPPLATFGIPAS